MFLSNYYLNLSLQKKGYIPSLFLMSDSIN